MPSRTKLFVLILSVILITAWVVVQTSTRPVYKQGSSPLYDNVVSAALSLYKERIKQGIDMSRGPCLTNDLMPGWVVDIVHSPRAEMDNLPANQCQAYLEGRATHFVELDTSGNLVRLR